MLLPSLTSAQKPEVIHELVDTLAPWILSTPPNLKGSPLLGLAYDVALHLRKEDIKLSVTSQLVVSDLEATISYMPNSV